MLNSEQKAEIFNVVTSALDDAELKWKNNGVHSELLIQRDYHNDMPT